MRNSNHNTEVHLCRITGDGLKIVNPLEGVTGILGWSTLTDTALVLEPGTPLPA